MNYLLLLCLYTVAASNIRCLKDEPYYYSKSCPGGYNCTFDVNITSKNNVPFDFYMFTSYKDVKQCYDNNFDDRCGYIQKVHNNTNFMYTNTFNNMRSRHIYYICRCLDDRCDVESYVYSLYCESTREFNILPLVLIITTVLYIDIMLTSSLSINFQWFIIPFISLMYFYIYHLLPDEICYTT